MERGVEALKYTWQLIKPETGPLNKRPSLALHRLISDHFDEGELADLILALGGRPDHVVGRDDNLPEQALAVVLWAERHGLKRRLLGELSNVRPGVEWPE